MLSDATILTTSPGYLFWSICASATDMMTIETTDLLNNKFILQVSRGTSEQKLGNERNTNSNSSREGV